MHATQKAPPARWCAQQEDQLPLAVSTALAKHGHCIQPDLGQGTPFTKPSLQRECLITRPIMGKYCFEGQNLEPLNDSHQWLTLPLDMNHRGVLTRMQGLITSRGRFSTHGLAFQQAPAHGVPMLSFVLSSSAFGHCLKAGSYNASLTNMQINQAHKAPL